VLKQKLQREIANQRGVLDDRSVGSPTTEASGDNGRISDGSPIPTGNTDRPGTETKRKYRRHPKPDKNAPERPPSAYVIFSNRIREEVRGQNLSFTDIAKLVGDRWQKLSSDHKEPFESQANAAKEKFNAELSQYKKTDSYKEYTQYMADFKAKHGSSIADGKRLKLDQESVAVPGRSNETMSETKHRLSTAHYTRDLSVGSVSSTSYHGGDPSPKGGSTTVPSTMVGCGMSSNLSRISSSPVTNSPPLRPDHRELRMPPVLPVPASSHVEARPIRGDLSDLHARAGQLSLGPLGNSTIQLTGDPASANRPPAAFPRPFLQHQSSSASSNTYSDSSGASNGLPVTPADEAWRLQPVDSKVPSQEGSRIYHPLLGNKLSTHFTQLPPLHPTERLPDISAHPTHGTLPFPGSPCPHDLKTIFKVRPRNQAPLPPSDASAGSSSEPRDEIKSPLETSESDAANALAVLACTGR
jgi:HMG (high mobility group) box